VRNPGVDASVSLASRPCGPGRRWTPDELARAFLSGAWRPADLPFAPAHKPSFSPEATSSLSAAMLAEVEVWPYRRDLHIVVEAPDRVLAASCIAWLDPTTHAAAIEPLGVRPRTAGGDWLAPFACVRCNLSTGQVAVKSWSILEATRAIRRR
jgi:hypothetical protein